MARLRQIRGGVVQPKCAFAPADEPNDPVAAIGDVEMQALGKSRESGAQRTLL